MERHEFVGTLPICTYKDSNGNYCHMGRRHENHDATTKIIETWAGPVDLSVKSDEQIKQDRDAKANGDAASIVFRTENLQEIEKETHQRSTAKELMDAQNAGAEFVVSEFCNGPLEEWPTVQRPKVLEWMDRWYKAIERQRAEISGGMRIKAQRDEDYARLKGFTDEERAQFIKDRDRMHKSRTKIKIGDAPKKAVSKDSFIKGMVATGIFTQEQAEQEWLKTQSPAKKPETKKVTTVEGAIESMIKLGMSRAEAEAMIKGKRQ
jgi:hypothetical protein